MIRSLASRSALLAGLALAMPAAAQFRVDLAPSAMRAANQPNKPPEDPIPNRLNPLFPLGGRPGTPVNKPVTTAVEPIQAYAGVPVEDASANPRPGVGVTAGTVDNPAVEDPNKPRKPLRPNTLKRGVAPRS